MRRVRATAAIAAAALAGTMAVWATPAQAAGTGVITGKITTANGAPAADIWVAAMDFEEWGEPVGYATTAADGTYRIQGLATDSYVVSMSGTDHPQQYFDSKTDIWEADEVRVTNGQTTTINQQLIATGFLTGRILQANGEPLAWTWINAVNEYGSSVGGQPTDDNGDYRIPVPPGRYQVSFSPIEDSYQEQFIPGKISQDDATTFTVTVDQETRADDTVLAIGSLSGRLTNDNGTPVADASVYANPFQANGYLGDTPTNANGEFSIPQVLVGTYSVEFYAGNRHQYFDGAIEAEDADPVVVTAGNNTRITDSLLPTGTIRVRAVDAITGITIRDFCAYDVCDDGTGVALMTDQTVGTHVIDVNAYSGNYLSRSVTATVKANQTTDVVVRLLPGAKITTTVVDKATGSPLADVCVLAYQPGRARIPDNYGGDQCSDAAGKVTIDRLAAGDYRLFAVPRNQTYGQQWVTTNGGAGDERQATTITVATGKSAAGPQVKVDRAGSIRGRVTDAATGEPLQARIALFTANPGLGSSEEETDEDGNFQVDGLGPYRWPLKYSSFGYATTWTGGAVTRYSATGTQVTAGAVATANLGLTRGVTVTGDLVISKGTPTGWGRVSVLNTTTGDYVDTSDFVDTTVYELHVLPGQEIRYVYDVEIDGDYVSSDKAKLAPATPGGPVRYAVTVPAGGLDVDILVN
ncbi:carboxypeptidase regulatory-like domain-containing protein [Asanoa sp. NPDC049518]|uniref:carboxypeptidase regulatory-like domain-containing protein n=1 Tax=unclassified Asanoa TaxID=2685164 RepID=UPI00342BDD98